MVTRNRYRSSSNEQNREQTILDFWHRVEFFIPFDLDQKLDVDEDDKWMIRRVAEKHLAALAPQSAGEFWSASGIPAGQELRGFELYLGVFDKSYLSSVVKQLLNTDRSELERCEEEERGDVEGLTCFAKLPLNVLGEPQIEKISVSTAPWALGQLGAHGFAGLDFESFEASEGTLQVELKNFVAERTKPDDDKTEDMAPTGTTAEKPPKPLVRVEIEKLLSILYEWAGYVPAVGIHPAAVIKVLVKKIRTDDTPKETVPTGDRPSASELAQGPPVGTEEEGSDEDASADDGIEILNSFFAKDIQRILRGLKGGSDIGLLRPYLNPLTAASRVDLYRGDGPKHIVAGVRPRRLPQAHWPGDPKHAMSLMQQFAINEILGSLEVGDIFSINGPPGTGKTTLLREIFAENITRRARVLASLDHASEAFLANNKVRIELGTESRFVPPLRDDLTGFEMVVVSSNNSAVENISVDLPKADALGRWNEKAPREGEWRHADGSPKLTYLQPVANQHACRAKNGTYKARSISDTPWGLISCALGNWENRERFRQGVLFGVKEKEKGPKGYDRELYKSIWQWRKEYGGVSFVEAKHKFIAADRLVKERQADLERYAAAIEEVAGRDADAYAESELIAVDKAESQAAMLRAAMTALTSSLNTQTGLVGDIKDLVVVLRAPLFREWVCKPSQLFAHWRKVRDIKKKLAIALEEKVRLTGEISSLSPNLRHMEDSLATARREYEIRVAKWNTQQADMLRLRAIFPEADFPAGFAGIEGKECQKVGYWFDAKFNQLRAELFASAMQLHEAWLADVLQNNGGFGTTVVLLAEMIRGRHRIKPEHALVLWQSLFMIVPIVSTTFASVARQFRDLGPSTLGWLFIDEAGQAVPQAAAGALWRSRRAVVVGDPLQIEPVFTVPVGLINALAEASKVPDDAKVLPHQSSVQNLADAANRYGTVIHSDGDDGTWIGSPLRVHRRCYSPMFDLANSMAYSGKMIFGFDDSTIPEDALDLGRSSWVQISGAAKNRQAVPDQICLVAQALTELYAGFGKLPPLYIISPFRQIKLELTRAILSPDCWMAAESRGAERPSSWMLKEWCKSHVGTVHTFQGKQQSIVWMVLGCDQSTESAAAWASSKPNILNVAMTRAEHRFFLIGDADIWYRKGCFGELDEKSLPRITPEEFVQRIRGVAATKEKALHK